MSPRLKSDWDSGVRYYPFDGQRLVVRPAGGGGPSQEALAWHGRKVFSG